MLEEAAFCKNPLERFKRVMGFGVSNSVLSCDAERPFNPLLGETYQGYIRGCPIYAEQICQHPPTTAVYLVGRGYTVAASLQAKATINVGTFDLINEGFYHVAFSDGQEVLFQTPPVELSGLAMGSKRFNIIGTGYYIDEKNRFFAEMRFARKGATHGENGREFDDQIEG
jgi:hypothetical protein